MKSFSIILIFQVLVVPSFQLILSPCRVENIVTHPHFATSLATKALVQVVQIPPVFIQNVITGKCVNSTSELSMASTEYHICKQRYSAVEVYVMDQVSIPLNATSNMHTITENFRKGKFHRDFVVVESGCDFSFNLLPLLLQNQQQRYNSVPQVPTSQNPPGYPSSDYHFLKSPYYPLHPEASQPSEPEPEPQPQPNQQNQPSIYILRGNYGGGGGGAIQGRAKPVRHHDHHGHAYSFDDNDSYPGSGTSSSTTTTTTTTRYYAPDAPSIPESELYGISDKIGLPLYILSPEADPLLNNIENIQLKSN